MKTCHFLINIHHMIIPISMKKKCQSYSIHFSHELSLAVSEDMRSRMNGIRILPGMVHPGRRIEFFCGLRWMEYSY